MNEQKARELAADVIKLHRPDYPTVTSELVPSPDRWKERSRTYLGLADAMADQWTRATRPNAAYQPGGGEASTETKSNERKS